MPSSFKSLFVLPPADGCPTSQKSCTSRHITPGHASSSSHAGAAPYTYTTSRHAAPSHTSTCSPQPPQRSTHSQTYNQHSCLFQHRPKPPSRSPSILSYIPQHNHDVSPPTSPHECPRRNAKTYSDHRSVSPLGTSRFEKALRVDSSQANGASKPSSGETKDKYEAWNTGDTAAYSSHDASQPGYTAAVQQSQPYRPSHGRTPSNGLKRSGAVRGRNGSRVGQGSAGSLSERLEKPSQGYGSVHGILSREERDEVLRRQRGCSSRFQEHIGAWEHYLQK